MIALLRYKQVASELSLPIGFERAEAIKGYLNVYFSSKAYARRVIDIVLEEGAAFGRAPRRGRRTMVEFAQPNTHKSFHVGHLRNVILGNVVCNLIDAGGDDVIRTTYLGDIGLHVIKWMWCYLKYHAGEKPTGDITRWMGDLYTEASQRAESEPGADGEIRETMSGLFEIYGPSGYEITLARPVQRIEGPLWIQLYNYFCFQSIRSPYPYGAREPIENHLL